MMPDTVIVTPCVGVWIEISGPFEGFGKADASLPAWECGLKLLEEKLNEKAPKSHSLRGSVD